MALDEKNKLQVNYSDKLPLAQQFAQRLSEQLHELLLHEKISLAVPIEFRVKLWDSIQNKIDRKNLKLRDIADLEDLVGLRIILLFKRDVDRVSNLISSSFSIMESENTQERLGVSQFGYQSIHFRITLPDTWLKVPTFAKFEDFCAEIQVRTAAQHIWAAASHKLQYKQEGSVPHEVLRSINRVSALLETVDLEFERALVERESYASVVDHANNSDVLNVDNLRIILDKELPAKNKDIDEPYAELLEDLLAKEIRTVGNLRDLLNTHKETVISLDQRIAITLRADGVFQDDGTVFGSINGTNYETSEVFINRGVFYSQVGLVRVILEKIK